MVVVVIVSCINKLLKYIFYLDTCTHTADIMNMNKNDKNVKTKDCKTKVIIVPTL